MSSSPDAEGDEISERSPAHFDFRILEDLSVKISDLATDSRKVKQGDTFLAYAGERSDGRNFIRQAIAAGATAVLWEREGFAWDPAWKAPNLPISGLRSKAGIIADYVYGHPSQKLWLIGITGTNGKTSCSHWIAQALTALGKKTAVIGTLGTGFCDALELSANTTPDAVLLQQNMADLLRRGAYCLAMEVSSHGIVQERVNGSTFSVALFTNLSRDHLDYHGSMEAYAASKARLFRWPGLRYAVLNLDDAFGADLSNHLLETDAQIIGYGFTEAATRTRDTSKFRILRGYNLKASPEGLAFDIEFEAQHLAFETEVAGRFNASNLLGVLATLLASGFGLVDAARALREIRPVAGRMQQIGGGNQPLVIVDYAHTPDAMEKVLTALREILHSGPASNTGSEAQNPKLICVFGCGGDRDRGKRPLLGEVATRLADEVIVTNDNPRQEDAEVIIGEIVAGAGINHQIEMDRTKAISRAIHHAKKGDVILIAGKGHEAYQEIDGQKFPFSDVEVARRVLMERARVQT
jgi:UDP-N-acetylmuramoyl-L-alanyl-D-glutamate--2,6-diaminopimelate ligase